MKVLKNGFILKDFYVTFTLGKEVKEVVVKDKGSRAQAISQIIKERGNKAQVISIKSM